MSKLGSFRLAAQHENWGYFGYVEMELDVLGPGDDVSVAIPEEVKSWRAGLQFGILYAYERSALLRPERRDVRVRVIQAIGHAVDTTEVVMAFVSAQAFWRALDESPPCGFSLDASRAMFTFPK
jgi:hypothetical protein